jgi:hypothetical protein
MPLAGNPVVCLCRARLLRSSPAPLPRTLSFLQTLGRRRRSQLAGPETANRVAWKPPSHPPSPTGTRCASVAGRRAAVAGQQPKGRRCLLAAAAGRYRLGAATAGATCRPAAGAQIHGAHGGEVDHLNLNGPDFFLMKSHRLVWSSSDRYCSFRDELSKNSLHLHSLWTIRWLYFSFAFSFRPLRLCIGFLGCLFTIEKPWVWL